ncbi:MAG: competence protein ComEA [Paraglaciecola sp.]|jgi:competence protein ComEA
MSLPTFKYLKGTKFERNASILFLSIGIIGILFYFSSFIYFKNSSVDFSPFDGFSTDFLSKKEAPIPQSSWRNSANKNRGIPLFDFDPNTVSKEELMRLGLSSKIANTIHNFRSKNGKFYKSEDLKKIYGFRAEDYERLKDYIKINLQKSYAKKRGKSFQKTDNQIIIKPFDFNPNEASLQDFQRLGFTKKLAQRIVNYRNKGGHFYKKEDLKKIYDFTEDLYLQLENYIVLPQQEKVKKYAQSTYAKKDYANDKSSRPSVKIDINQSSAEDWQQLRGIGPGYAKKIMNFRDKLGGFVTLKQVSETYYFPDSVFQKIKPYLIKSPILKKIKINKIPEEELKKHPYFSWKQAKSLVRYRKQHGNFVNTEDLQKIIGVFKAEDWTRIAPYLEF